MGDYSPPASSALFREDKEEDSLFIPSTDKPGDATPPNSRVRNEPPSEDDQYAIEGRIFYIMVDNSPETPKPWEVFKQVKIQLQEMGFRIVWQLRAPHLITAGPGKVDLSNEMFGEHGQYIWIEEVTNGTDGENATPNKRVCVQ